MNFTIITSAVSIALGFGGAWSLRGHQIDKLKLDQANERISLQRAARATLERSLSNSTQAANNATLRGVAIRSNAAGTAAAGNGLRLTTEATVRAATDNPAACSQSAAALGAVFDLCSTELQSLAEKADRHVSDLQTLMAAWPKE